MCIYVYVVHAYIHECMHVCMPTACICTYEHVHIPHLEDLYPLDVLQAWDSAAEFIALFARWRVRNLHACC